MAGGLVEIMSRQGKLSSYFWAISLPIYNDFRVFAIGYRSLERLCLGLGGEVLHGH
jgi:hypothetical protein